MKTSKSAKTRAESPKKTTKTFKPEKPEMKEKKIQTTPKKEKARSESPDKPKKTARAESPKKVAKSEKVKEDTKVGKIEKKDESKKVRAKQSSDKKPKEEKKESLRAKSPSAKSSKSVDVKNRAKADSAPKSRSKTVKFENEVKDKPKKIKKDEDVKMSDASNASKEFHVNDIIEQPKPKKWMTPYMFFVTSRMQEIKGKTIEHKENTQIMKKAGEDWKVMDDKQKAQFVKMSEKDKVRFENEVKENEKKGWFTNSDGIKSTDFKMMKPKFKPDVVQPKGVTTPYGAFMKENFPKIAEEIKSKELSKVAPIISERWTKMTDDEKKPYFNLVEQDRERYDGEIQSLVTKGFFINKKGQKSSDLKVKSKRKPAVELPQKRIASSEDAPATKKLKK